jgi:glycosyltransferase involved in cell wall biosynthesis
MEGSETQNPNLPSPNSVETVFGFAARLEEGKGPLVLLDALARVNRERMVAVARIAGMGPSIIGSQSSCARVSSA